jgi:xylulokinase
MPKDYINFRLTGARAIDFPEASCNYLLDVDKRSWSEEMVGLTGLDLKMLPPLKNASEVLGMVHKEAARETGLLEGTPVVVGAGDYPVTLLGSGVTRAGMGSDVTGTSTLITLMTEKPVLDPAITNVEGVAGGWGAFTILDAGGDAMRWARRAFHDNQYSYERIVELAREAPAGADRLLFLPYLNGERLAKQSNSRAQFVGLTSGHAAGHLHRAVMEGVAFASLRNIEIMKARGNKLERLVAAGGGAKTKLWLEIKASVYGCPILTVADPECGVLGCAMLAGVGAGIFDSIEDAVQRLVRYDTEIQPDPSWSDRYQRMAAFFNRVYSQSETYWNEMEDL